MTSQYDIHLRCSVALRILNDMRVNVHGRVQLRVAKQLHCYTRLNALSKQQAGASVAQVMKTLTRESGQS